jgi:hypothetical protein
LKQRSEQEIEEIIELVLPIVKKALLQTSPQNRDDLQQEIYKFIIQKMKNKGFVDHIDFFELLKKETTST